MPQNAPDPASADPVGVVLGLAGTGRHPAGPLVLVDGPAGSGKTTLAGRLADAVAGSVVVHTDDLIAGWDGLPDLAGTLAGLLGDWAGGDGASYVRWDWYAGTWSEQVPVPSCPLLVVEGVGSGSLPGGALADVLVWVEAPHDLRMRRGLERDGEAFAPHWERWAREEAELFARHGTRARADVVVDGAEGRALRR